MRRLLFVLAWLCLSTLAGSTQFNGCPAGFCSPTAVGGGVSPASYTAVYGNSQAFAFGPGPYTSPSQTWTAGVAVVSVWSSAQNIDLSVTIKGVSASQIGGYSGTGHRCSAWRATITSGSGTVVVSSVGNVFDSVGTVGGVVTTTTPTPSGFQISDMAVAAEPQTVVTVTVPSSGVGVFAAAAEFGSSASLPLTWTVVTRDSITESFIGTGTASSDVAGGSHTATPGSTTPGVSSANATFNFAGTSGCMTAVAFSP